MAQIQISVNCDRIKSDPERLAQTAERILNALDCSNGELSLVLTDDEEMADLNARFRGVAEPTDVLSFPMREGDFAEIAPQMLGDVVIGLETAQAMAEKASCSLEEILDLLLVHGILHLLGYNHGDPAEAAAMDALTVNLLQQLGHDPARFAWYRTDFSQDLKEG